MSLNSSSLIPSQWATLIRMCALLFVFFLYPRYNKVCKSHKYTHPRLNLMLCILTLLPKTSLLHTKATFQIYSKYGLIQFIFKTQYPQRVPHPHCFSLLLGFVTLKSLHPQPQRYPKLHILRFDALGDASFLVPRVSHKKLLYPNFKHVICKIQCSCC